MRPLNKRKLMKRKEYLSKLSKKSYDVKETKNKCLDIAKKVERKIEKIDDEKIKEKMKEILKNNLRLLDDLNNQNKERVLEIFQKFEKI